MNIAFDSVAIAGSRNRGVGKYTSNLLDALIEAAPEIRFYYFNYSDEDHIGKYIKQKRNIKEVHIYTDSSKSILLNNKYAGIFGGILRGYIEKYNIDVFCITSPFDRENCPVYKKKWFGNASVCTIFYDLIPLLYKEHYLADPVTYEDYFKRIEMLTDMNHIFAISNCARRDLCENSTISFEKISVILGAPDEIFHPNNYTREEIEDLNLKYKIRGKYIISVSGDDERKNIDGLIEAYAGLPEDIRNIYQLVIVCKISEESLKRYLNLIHGLRVDGRVCFTNFVEDSDLVKLYNNASISAFVSKYEGFGLPVVESYACQIPVVTSNNSSLAEVGDNAAILVDPFDVSSIKKGLLLSLQLNEDERKKRIECGRQLLKKYSWDNIAIGVLRDLKGMSSKPLECGYIAYFTSLPPIQSGISDYSVDILLSISKYYEAIDVFIDTGYKPECNFPDNIHIYQYSLFDASRYDKVIFQMGNNTNHTYMIDIIKKNGGIVELHDVNLNGLIQAITIWKDGNWNLYREYAAEDFSDVDVDNLIQNLERNSESGRDVVLNGIITNYAEKIIVHSEWARQQLIEKDISLDVDCVNLYGIVNTNNNKISYRKKYGYKDDDIIIGTFGFLHSTKRILQSIEACKKLWEEKYKFKLVLVGEMETTLISKIEEFKNDSIINGNMITTGFVDLNVFDEYMDIIDIGLNLRFPYNGETSASCTKMMAKGKCIIVNDIGAFSEIDDDACIKIPNAENMSDKEEVNQIQQTLKMLLNNRTMIETVSQRAYQYALRELDIDKISKKLVKAYNTDAIVGMDKDDFDEYARIVLSQESDASIHDICSTIATAKMK